MRGFQQSSSSPIGAKEVKQDPATLQSPTVPQSALAARLKDPTSPSVELEKAISSGSLPGNEASTSTDKNKVGPPFS